MERRHTSTRQLNNPPSSSCLTEAIAVSTMRESSPLLAHEGIAVLLLLEVRLLARLVLRGNHVVAVAVLGLLVELDGDADEDVGDVANLGVSSESKASALGLADGDAVVDVGGLLLVALGEVLLLESLVAHGLVVADHILVAAGVSVSAAVAVVARAGAVVTVAGAVVTVARSVVTVARAVVTVA